MPGARRREQSRTGGRSFSVCEMSQRRYFFVLLLLLLASCILVPTAKAEVINLTADTFSDKVKEKNTVWFVQFCVPWCKYCKNMGSLWEDLARAVEGEDEIEIGQVDCSTSKSICTKVDIHSYPTFKVSMMEKSLQNIKERRKLNHLERLFWKRQRKQREQPMKGMTRYNMHASICFC